MVGTANLICVLVIKNNIATQLFVDSYTHIAITMRLRSIDSGVLIDIYTNKPLAPTMSLNYQCCLLTHGRTLDDVGQY